MAYRALKPIKFGGRYLSPGDPVPVEPGRDYAMMERVGDVERSTNDPLPPVSDEEREAAGTGVEAVEGEVAADLDTMDRDALKAFAESQEITGAVDMRLGTVKLRAAIKTAIA